MLTVLTAESRGDKNGRKWVVMLIGSLSHFSRRHRRARLIFAFLVLIRPHYTIWEPGTGYVHPNLRSVVFRDRRYLVFCFLGCVVKFPACEADTGAGGEARARILAIEFVCFFSLFLSFLVFFFPFLLIAFFHEQTHTGTHTTKRGAERRGKAERRHWRAVGFTQFVDYRLMFD